MSIFNTIKSRQLQARKNKDTNAINILTVLLGELQRRAIQTTPTDEDVFKAAAALKKSLTDTISKNSTEAAIQELAVIDEVLALAPVVEMATDEEHFKVLSEFVECNPTAQMGQLISHLKTALGARTDGKNAKRVVDIFNTTR